MSILKMVNEKQTDRKRLYDKFDYLTAASKTNNGKLVGTTNCISRYTAEEMLMIKRIYHKCGGRCWIEIVLSMTPDEASRPDKEYMEIAKAVADIFEDFQCLYSVHLDARIRHVHILLNTVSIRNGKKFTQSPSGLQRLKQKTNDILLKYGFDIIKTGVSEMIDRRDHSEDENFDYLEIDENEPIYKPDEIEVLSQGIDVERDGAGLIDEFPELSEEDKEWYLMIEESTEYTQEQENWDEKDTALCPRSSVSIEQYPHSDRPTISVDVAPHYTLNVSGNTMDDDLFQAARELGQTTPEQLNAGANMAMALHSAAMAKGFDVNITVNAAPTIEINFDSGIKTDSAAITIDADYKTE